MKKKGIFILCLILIVGSHYSSAQDQRTYDINLTEDTHLKVVGRMDETTLRTGIKIYNVSLYFYYCDSETTSIFDIQVHVWLKQDESGEIIDSVILNFDDLYPEDVAIDQIIQNKEWYFFYDRNYGKCSIYLRPTCKEERVSEEVNFFDPSFGIGFWLYPEDIFQIYKPIFITVIVIGGILIIIAAILFVKKFVLKRLKSRKTAVKTDSPYREEWGSYCTKCGNFVFFDEGICNKCRKPIESSNQV